MTFTVRFFILWKEDFGAVFTAEIYYDIIFSSSVLLNILLIERFNKEAYGNRRWSLCGTDDKRALFREKLLPCTKPVYLYAVDQLILDCCLLFFSPNYLLENRRRLFSCLNLSLRVFISSNGNPAYFIEAASISGRIKSE